MNPYKVVPGSPGFFVVDPDWTDGEHPTAVCENAEDANMIADSLNVVAELDSNVLVVGSIWQKAGVSRAIVDIDETFVWYENVPTRAVIRMKVHRFLNWMRGAKLVRVFHPTRRKAVDR